MTEAALVSISQSSQSLEPLMSHIGSGMYLINNFNSFWQTKSYWYHFNLGLTFLLFKRRKLMLVILFWFVIHFFWLKLMRVFSRVHGIIDLAEDNLIVAIIFGYINPVTQFYWFTQSNECIECNVVMLHGIEEKLIIWGGWKIVNIIIQFVLGF